MTESVIDIDPNRLDAEWVDQPKRYLEWSDRLAEARRDHEEAKAQLELTEAEVSDAVRRHPAEFGIEKVTVDAVRSAVVQSDRYRRAVDEVNRTRYQSEKRAAVVSALDHRKRALEKLVELWLASYFSSPRERNSTEMRDAAAAKAFDRRGKK